MTESYNPHGAEPIPDEVYRSLQDLSPQEQDELVRTWHLSGTTASARQTSVPAVPDTDRFLAALRRESRPSRPTERAPVAPTRSKRWPYLVGFLSVLGIAFLIWTGQPVSVVVPQGTTMTVALPDGSTAQVNSSSTLTYRRWPIIWGRGANLSGEAFFDVEPGQRPFVVETFNATVVVHGTAFNVRAWPDDLAPETWVMLKTGSVEVTDRNTPNTPVRLSPGQESRVLGLGTPPTAPQNVDPDLGLVWLQGGFSFVEKPLGTVLAELERRLNVEISVSRAVDTTLFLTWTRPQPTNIETALIELCSVASCRFERTHHGYHIGPFK